LGPSYQTTPKRFLIDLAAAHAMILAERAARIAAEVEPEQTRSSVSNAEAFIAYLKLEIEN
jgi:hypothetical protein